MKALLEIVELKSDDVVTASTVLCGGEAPCIETACEDPDLDM